MGNQRRHLTNYLGNLSWLPSEYSSKEDTGTVTAVGDLVPPKTPTNVIASNGTERINIEWDKVTKNFDDSDCNDLSHYNVYYSASSGIDINDNTTYDGVEVRDTLTWSQEVSAGNTKYYVVTAEDDTGNESSASSETSATSQAVTFTVNVSDYTDNFSDIQVGDGIIGLIFRQPNSGWDGYSHYKLYRDVIGGSTWTSIFEGPNPAYVDKGVSSGTNYKYKLTFVDVDGGETSGTIRDNSSSGYNPNNADNSNITAQTFLAPNIVAQNEVRGNEIYASSEIEIASGGKIYSGNNSYATGEGWWIGDVSGTPKLSIGDFTNNDAWLKWDGASLSIKGSLTITGGSGIGNLTDAGSLAEQNDADWSADVTGTAKPADNATVGADWTSNLSNIPDRHTNSATTGLNLTSSYLGFYDGASWKAYINSSGVAEFKNDLIVGDTGTSNYLHYDVSAGTLTVEGSITANSISVDSGNVQIGPNALPDGSAGLYVANGGKIEVTDTSSRTIFDSSGKFWGAPQLADMTASRSNDLVSGLSFRTIISTSGASSVSIYGGIVTAEVETYAEAGSCYVRITDDTSFEDIYAAFGSFRYQTYNVGNPAIIIPIPTFQSKGDVTIEYYNADDSDRYAQWQISYQTQ